MDSVWQTVLGVTSGAVLILIFYFAKNALSVPSLRVGAKLTVIVSAKDPSQLEQAVRGLMTLRRERVLNANIVITTKGHDEEFIRMAGILAGRYDGISVR